MRCFSSQSMAARLASAMPSPFSQSLLIFGPSSGYASPSHPSGGCTVRTIGSSCALAKSQSRWSSPGTAMIAPVP
jgi:hypothetical protein